MLSNDFDVILLCETWLSNAFKSEEFFPTNYTVFRQDRYGDTENSNAMGGGLITAIRSELIVEKICAHRSGADLLNIKVKCGDFWLFIVNLYIVSRCPDLVYLDFLDYVTKTILPLIRLTDKIVFIGDFNLFKIDWRVVGNDLFHTSSDVTSMFLLDKMSSFGCKQYNNIHNQHGRILDLVFSSDESLDILSCDDLAEHTSIYHTTLWIKFYFPEITRSEEHTSELQSQ